MTKASRVHSAHLMSFIDDSLISADELLIERGSAIYERLNERSRQLLLIPDYDEAAPVFPEVLAELVPEYDLSVAFWKYKSEQLDMPITKVDESLLRRVVNWPCYATIGAVVSVSYMNGESKCYATYTMFMQTGNKYDQWLKTRIQLRRSVAGLSFFIRSFVKTQSGSVVFFETVSL